ncbi:J domain-containing protein [Vulcanococcus limneticus Candia 3F8]|uniref:J domain-containing protein n=1 Tax=Vulcanococcus limneticus TaxID=2170428 RepID=UPI000B98B7E2|nr:J domain-containing protein [Vulcanococcus limneticus]MCP9792668.1 J domain-containing protein [Vulcanococcus limneticus MW73D5]MCP9894533.1 J domain-containing protein [Vulcanococcus limneticus Candia 3F8]MCP9898135.1 J domain-containing protein [Vulcanococcus limneticus Candia 3B3]
MVGDGQGEARRRISLELSESLLERIDAFKAEWGLRNRGHIVQRLLEQLFDGVEEDDEDDLDLLSSLSEQPSAHAAVASGEPTGLDATALAQITHDSDLNETGAIVLVHSALDSLRDQGLVQDKTPEKKASRRTVTAAAGSGGGIDLPGFVRRQGREIRRSLHPPRQPQGREPGLALISAEHLAAAALACQSHWLEIYGQPANGQALEAVMVWLAREIWPRSDQSEGRPFTWSLAQQILGSMAPQWEEGPASFERVILAAGILEDPFSGSTLALRVPTLITRFVQWARSRQKRGTSFHVLDHTLTVHGALRLLELPTDPNVPLSLAQIREAYRDQAQRHHPDAGGSADAMRRLNEAYQLLKEMHRKQGP